MARDSRPVKDHTDLGRHQRPNTKKAASSSQTTLRKRCSSDDSVPTRAAETPSLPPGLFMSGFLPTTLFLLRMTEAMSYHGPSYNHPGRPAVFSERILN